jgi:hypothetical protein
MVSGEFHLQVLMRISALIGAVDEPVVMFVTSQHFGQIASEVAGMDLMDPLNPPNPDNFKELRVGKNLLVVNSGSEDQASVNLANRMEAERTDFQGRAQRLRTG